MATKKTPAVIELDALDPTPTMLSALQEDANEGLEGADKDSYAIPFLMVLQGSSPQLDTIDGARPGMLCNSITDEIYKEALVIPCAFQRRYIRWGSRESGGGYKGEYHPSDIDSGKIPVDRNDIGLPSIEGDDLKDTRSHYVLVRSEKTGSWSPAILSLSSTQVRKSKRWMSLIRGLQLKGKNGKLFTPPSWSHIYKVTTQKEENSKGSWHGVSVSLEKMVDNADLYAMAKAFHSSVLDGQVEVDRNAGDPTAEQF